MHQALYRKWRPESFDDVSGQEHITSVLRYENEQGKLSHAYLFCGSRGVGKTTCAKILAKAVNCLHPVKGNPCGECEACRAIDSGAATDVLEMDAASNNGVDNIRDIRDEVMYAPASLKYRVYIVDEVHMLSQSAFNALLKTLEEPPSYVIFILATTEQHKLPATIISRCQRFEFRRISVPELSARIELIAREEGITLDRDAALLIARLSQGGMRDAISLLELCAGGGRAVTPELVNETVGSTGREGTMQMAEYIAAKNYDGIFAQIADTVRSSKDLSTFFNDMLSLWRDLLVFRTLPDPSRYLDLTESEAARLAEISKIFTRETLLWQSGIMERAVADMKNPGASKRTTAELALLKMCDEQLDSSSEALLSRISKLETALLTGSLQVAPVAIPVTAAPAASPVAPPKAEDKPAPVAAPAVEAPTAAAETPKPVAREAKKRSLRCWTEVVERISENDRMIGSFLRTAKAYTEEGRLCIRAASDFAKGMIDTPETLTVIGATVASLTGQKYEILVELGAGDAQANDDIIDEILETAEEL
ncbi:MAG: DNA polymerase III subunit gamma/tau [Clostridia bacterium]|nr:DNA polymerase III subunit gamma/tau [Clostridia bacterium]